MVARHDLYQRGFARTVVANQTDDLVGPYFEIDVTQSFYFAEGLGHIHHPHDTVHDVPPN